MRFPSWFIGVGILIGTTIGAGIFELPYVTLSAGWVATLFYALLLGSLTAFVHILYSKTIDAAGVGNFLHLSLQEGKVFFRASAFVVLGSLIFTLLVYIVLGAQFLTLLFPELSLFYAAFIFWGICSIPLFVRKKIFSRLELIGTMLLVLLLLIVGAFALRGIPEKFPAVNLSVWFLPFGPILFAFAGWTAVEPISQNIRNSRKRRNSIIYGAIIVFVLYALFVLGMPHLGSVTPDMISGLRARGALTLAALLGLFALWTSYVPSAEELKNALTAFRWGKYVALIAALFLPLVFFLLGFENLLALTEVAGGIFLSLQYLLILRLARKVLKPKNGVSIIILMGEVLFLFAAGYTIYLFAVS